MSNRPLDNPFIRAGALMAVGLVLIAWAWWQDIAQWAHVVWYADIYSHGVLVPFVSLWLVWRDRDLLAKVPPKPWVPGGAVILGAAGLWLLAALMEAQLPAHMAVVTAINGLALLVLGPAFCRRVLFALLFLYLAIPFGEGMVVPLQTLTAQLVIRMLAISGIAFSADGVLITLASGTYEVARACAGVKFLFTSVVTSVLLAHLLFRSWLRRALIVLAGLLVPLLANALRVYGILVISEATDQSFAKDVDHIIYGWTFLSVILLILIVIAYRFADRPARLAGRGDTVSAPVASGRGWHAVLPFLLVPVLVRLAVPPVDALMQCPLPAISAPVCVDCDYRQLDSAYARNWPQFVGTDQEVKALYRNAATRVQLYAALYTPERDGHRLTDPRNSLVADGWEILPAGGRGVVTEAGLPWQEVVAWQGDARRLVWQLMLIDGQAVVPGWRAKLAAGLSRFHYGFDRAAVIVLTADIGSPSDASEDQVRAEFRNFLSTFPPDTFLWSEPATPGDSQVSGEPICAASAG